MVKILWIREQYERHLVISDVVASIALWVALFCWVPDVWGRDVLAAALDSRLQIYNALVSVAGSLLGFILAAVSLLALMASIPEFKVLRKSKQFEPLFDFYFRAIFFLGLLVVMSIAALVTDTAQRQVHQWIDALAAVGILTTFFVCRCICFLKALTVLIARGRRS